MAGVANLLRQIKNEDWVTPAIDADRYAQETWRETDLAIHPSSLGSSCELALQWGLLGHRGPLTNKSRRRMDNGTNAHTRWGGEFESAGLLVAAELPVRNDRPLVKGSMDFILRRPVVGSLALVELKTTGERYFNSLRFGADRRFNMELIKQWRPGYAHQLAVYQKYGTYEGRRFDETFFLLENTNDQSFKVVPVVSWPELEDEALRYAVTAQEKLRRGELVARPYSRGSAICRQCDHEALCARYEDGDLTTVGEIDMRIHEVSQSYE